MCYIMQLASYRLQIESASLLESLQPEVQLAMPLLQLLQPSLILGFGSCQVLQWGDKAVCVCVCVLLHCENMYHRAIMCVCDSLSSMYIRCYCEMHCKSCKTVCPHHLEQRDWHIIMHERHIAIYPCMAARLLFTTKLSLKTWLAYIFCSVHAVLFLLTFPAGQPRHRCSVQQAAKVHCILAFH